MINSVAGALEVQLVVFAQIQQEASQSKCTFFRAAHSTRCFKFLLLRLFLPPVVLFACGSFCASTQIQTELTEAGSALGFQRDREILSDTLVPILDSSQCPQYHRILSLVFTATHGCFVRPSICLGGGGEERGGCEAASDAV